MAKINIESNIDEISGKFGSFGSTLLGPVKNALAAVRAGLTAISTHPIIAIIVVITGLFIALGKQLSKLQTVVDALDKAMTVLRQSFDFIITEIGAFLGLTESTGKSLAQVVAEAKALADAKVALAEATIVATTEQAELRVELSEYRAVAADATKTEQERIAALEEAERVNGELFESQRTLLEERIRLLELENSAGETSREGRQELADLQAQLIQLNADENNANRELIATKTGLIKTQEAKAEADRKEAQALREKNEQLEIEARLQRGKVNLDDIQRENALALAQGTITEAKARANLITELERQYDTAATQQEREAIWAELDKALFEDELARIKEGKEAYEKAVDAQNKADEERAATKMETTDAIIGASSAIGDALTTLAGENKDLAIAGLIVEQGAAVAEITVNTLRAISAAAPNVPAQIAIGISGAAQVAAAIGATVQGVNAIKNAPGPAASGSAGGGGATSIPFGPQAATPRTNSAGVAGEAGAGGATSVPIGQPSTIMAVVAEGEIANAAERNARTERKRRFGG